MKPRSLTFFINVYYNTRLGLSSSPLYYFEPIFDYVVTTSYYRHERCDKTLHVAYNITPAATRVRPTWFEIFINYDGNRLAVMFKEIGYFPDGPFRDVTVHPYRIYYGQICRVRRFFYVLVFFFS